MGIDFHSLSFLKYAARKRAFEMTLTIGRQGVHMSNHLIRDVLGSDGGKKYGPFCEDILIDHFGSIAVHSFDNSDFEKATFIHDFNKPLDHNQKYDTVIDVGTLEHIYNVPIAFENISNVCRKGGQIIHILPANNWAGHGFWQFSPELFFSLYSAKNGFSETEVFVAELDDERFWYRSSVPEGGIRVEYTSGSRSYLLVRTTKESEPTGNDVQQSDYVYAWESAKLQDSGSNSANDRLRRAISRIPLISRLVWMALKLYRDRKDPIVNARLHRLVPRNKHFTRLQISDLMKSIH